MLKSKKLKFEGMEDLYFLMSKYPVRCLTPLALSFQKNFEKYKYYLEKATADHVRIADLLDLSNNTEKRGL